MRPRCPVCGALLHERTEPPEYRCNECGVRLSHGQYHQLTTREDDDASLH